MVLFPRDRGYFLVDIYSRVFWLVCVFFLLSHFQVGVNQGILTAFGEQAYIALNMTWSCLLVGLPIVISTIFFTDLGLIGILLGWTTTKLILLLAGLIKLWRTDIGGEIEKSRLRVKKSTYGSMKTKEREERMKRDENESERMRMETRLEKDQCDIEEADVEKLADDLESTSDREIKIVVLTFFFTAIWFLMLAGMSSLRDFI